MRKSLQKFITQFQIIDSFIGILGVLFILGAALFIQFFYGETPCPLCLLQRAAFVGIGIALLMNLRYGNRTAHWATVLLCAASGAAVSIRQILLHITSPEGFGMPVLGIHMYTWCFLIFAFCIFGSAIMLLIYPEKSA